MQAIGLAHVVGARRPFAHPCKSFLQEGTCALIKKKASGFVWQHHIANDVDVTDGEVAREFVKRSAQSKWFQNGLVVKHSIATPHP